MAETEVLIDPLPWGTLPSEVAFSEPQAQPEKLPPSIQSPLENSNRRWNTALWERTPNQASFRAAAGATAAGFNTHSICTARVPPSLRSPTPAGIAIEALTSSSMTSCWRPNA
jgi:hypothetical protein